MKRVVELAVSDELEVRKEAILAVYNIASSGNVVSVVECGAIRAICDCLGINDTEMLLRALNTINRILKVGQKLGKDYVSFINECDGLIKIQNLQQHERNDVRKKADYIIDSYFAVNGGAVKAGKENRVKLPKK